MVSVNATASTALATLNFIKPRADSGNSPASLTSPGSDPMSNVRLSVGVSDAILKIGQIINSTKIANLPTDHADRLQSFGADAAVRVKTPAMSDDDFQKAVADYIKTNWSGLEGFSDALANGTVKIQRASEVEGLGYEMVRYDLYKDSSQIGGEGWSSLNRSFYDAVTTTGIQQGLGSIEGQGYYVTW